MNQITGPRSRRIARGAGFCLALAGSAAAAHGETVSAGLSGQFGPGSRDVTFNGDSRFGVLSDGGDGTLDVGDRLNGQFVVRNLASGGQTLNLGGVDAPPGTTVNELTGVVELEVLQKTGNATTGYTYEFGAFTGGNGTIVGQSGNSDAIIALYEDVGANGVLGGLPIPDSTVTDGQLYGYLGLNAPGTRRFTVNSVAGANGLHSDASSGGSLADSVLISTGDVSLNLIDQNGNAITDASSGSYTFGTNNLGTQFAGSFNFFGGAGTGADYTGTLALDANATVGQVQIIPLPPAVLAAVPGLMLVGYIKRRRLV